jgi:hypothetical protein
MKSRSRIIPAAFGVAVVLLILSLRTVFAVSGENKPEGKSFPAGVTLSEKAQEASGIRILLLQEISFTPKIQALGRVLDLTPLLEVRTRFQAASGKVREARAALTASRKEYNRARELYGLNRNVSEKTLQTAQAAWRTDQARLAAAVATRGDIRDEVRLRWGEPLADWSLGGKFEEAFSGLLSARQVLIEITPIQKNGLQAMAREVDIGPGESSAETVKARFLSPSPRVDPYLQGRSYFFLAPGSRFAAGMRVVAYIPLPDRTATGVIVPEDALIWYAGRAWAYIRTEPERFVRRPVATDTRAPGGWFVTDPEFAGAQVVVAGGQLLFSDEFLSVQGGAGEED